MTSTEYREYISSEQWRKRREAYLRSHDSCAICMMRREEHRELFDQDIHIHHISYARIGAELDSDLQALCRYHHEERTFGVATEETAERIAQFAGWMVTEAVRALISISRIRNRPDLFEQAKELFLQISTDCSQPPSSPLRAGE